MSNDDNAGLTPEQVTESRSAFERSIARGDDTLRHQQDAADTQPIPTGLEDYTPETPAEDAVPPTVPAVEDDMSPMQDPEHKSIFSDVNRMAEEEHAAPLETSEDPFVAPPEGDEFTIESARQNYDYARSQEHLVPAWHRKDEESQFVPEQDYSMTADELEGHLEEFPEHTYDNLADSFANAVSPAHLDWMKQQAREELAIDQKLMGHGKWAPIAYYMAAGVTDPAVVAATAPLPWIGQVLAPVVSAGKGINAGVKTWRRTRHFGKYAAYGAGENALIEAYLADSSMVRGREDIAYATLSGGLLGGAFGAAFAPKNRARAFKEDEAILHDVANKGMAEMEAEVNAKAAGKPAPIINTDTIRSMSENRHYGVTAPTSKAHFAEVDAAYKADREANYPPPPPEQAARLEEITARKEAIREEGAKLVAPVDSRTATAIRDMGRALDEYDSVTSKTAVSAKDRMNAEIRVNDVKRHFITKAKEEGDTELLKVIEKEFVGVNPKLSEFRKVYESKFAKVLAKESKAKEAGVAKYDEAVNKLDEELVTLRAEESTLAAAVEGKSGGAAFAGFEADIPFAERLGPNIHEELDAATPTFAMTKWRWDISASDNKSPNAGQRFFSSRMFEEGTGIKKGSGRIVDEKLDPDTGEVLVKGSDNTVAPISATEIQSMHRSLVEMDYAPAFQQGFKEWMESQPKGKWTQRERFDAVPELEFGREITKYNLDPSVEPGPGVVRAAAGFSKGIRRNLEHAQLNGVKGYEKIEHGPHWMPRIINPEKVRNTYNYRNMEAGENIEGIFELALYKGLRKEQPWADDKILRDIAKRYADNTVNRMSGGHSIDLATPDLERLQVQLVEDLGMDPELAAEYIKGLGSNREKLGKHAKKRLAMDLNVSVKVKDANGKETELFLYDMFETDPGKMLNAYTHTVGGEASMVEAFKGGPVPIKSNGDMDNFIKWIQDEDVRLGERSSYVLGREAEHRQIAIGSIQGRPITDGRTGEIYLRRLLDFNYMQDMGMVPITQLGEVGNVMSYSSMKTAWQHNGLKQALKRMAGEKEQDHLGATLQAATGLGQNWERGGIAFRHFEQDADGHLKDSTTLDQTLRKGGRVTGRVQDAMMKQQTDFAHASFVQEFVNDALRSGNKRKKLTDERLRDLGISSKDRKAIEKELLKHGTFEDGNIREGSKYANPNFDKWDNPEMVTKLTYAISRKSRSVIQEQRSGTMHRWQMTSKVARVLGQFQSFVTGAWGGQFMKLFARRDLEALRGVIGSTFTVTLANYLRIQTAAAFKEDRDDYLDRQFNDYQFYKTTLFRMPHMSIMGRLLDTASVFTTGEPIAEPYRSSSLVSALDLEANPTGRRWGGAWSLATNLTQMAVTGKGQFSKKELRQLKMFAPLQSLPPMAWAYNALEDSLDLPKSNKLPGQYGR